MKARGVAIQGALAAAGLVVAYVTWQRPEQETGAEVVVLDLSKSDVKSVKYDDPRRGVEIFREGDVVWVKQTEKPPAPPRSTAATADAGTALAASDGGAAPAIATAGTDGGAASPVAMAGADAGTADGGAVTAATATPTPPPTTWGPKVREYRANDTADKLLERFAPLYAVRGLGTLPAEKLKEVGLSESDRFMEVVTSKGAHRYRIAKDATGSGSPYVKDENDGKVYLVKQTLISDLEFASSRLVDRSLHRFQNTDFDAVVVKSGGKDRRLTKTGERLTDASGNGDDFATNWQDKLWRMMGVDVLGRGEDPAAGKPEVKLRVDYLRKDKPVGFIELATAGSDVFARTEHTAGWVRLHMGAKQTIDEAAKVVEPK